MPTPSSALCYYSSAVLEGSKRVRAVIYNTDSFYWLCLGAHVTKRAGVRDVRGRRGPYNETRAEDHGRGGRQRQRGDRVQRIPSGRDGNHSGKVLRMFNTYLVRPCCCRFWQPSQQSSERETHTHTHMHTPCCAPYSTNHLEGAVQRMSAWRSSYFVSSK